jgi:hypothetical protein
VKPEFAQTKYGLPAAIISAVNATRGRSLVPVAER